MTLAIRDRPDHDIDRAVSQDGDVGALAWNARRGVEIVGNRDTTAASARLRNARPLARHVPISLWRDGGRVLP
jgi:hypothetical protein